MSTSFKETIFGCCSSFNKEISRIAVEGTWFRVKLDDSSDWSIRETHPFVLGFKSDLLHGHNLVGLLVASLKVNHFKLEITNKQ